ncbi:uncharacterized protein BO97DRAFT_411688 [Aspergillus homomorphus CBS 101889]|uniref:Uncharacterized protein n=1 Tax=Aspergillus homomorphus (strain CBS 101889) TaxID=1450537 RepID=A0A395IBQ4_ASPHC|nr:hypothetical protein BO97DRAFT_411688 [Aspergillus homomorphus CBS 101889]RAL15584.1 hypothetical protein BO97DRAFT_411688 [Aspergillus homomorphus CBS 101889]
MTSASKRYTWSRQLSRNDPQRQRHTDLGLAEALPVSLDDIIGGYNREYKLCLRKLLNTPVSSDTDAILGLPNGACHCQPALVQGLLDFALIMKTLARRKPAETGINSAELHQDVDSQAGMWEFPIKTSAYGDFSPSAAACHHFSLGPVPVTVVELMLISGCAHGSCCFR